MIIDILGSDEEEKDNQEKCEHKKIEFDQRYNLEIVKISNQKKDDLTDFERWIFSLGDPTNS